MSADTVMTTLTDALALLAEWEAGNPGDRDRYSRTLDLYDAAVNLLREQGRALATQQASSPLADVLAEMRSRAASLGPSSPLSERLLTWTNRIEQALPALSAEEGK